MVGHGGSVAGAVCRTAEVCINAYVAYVHPRGSGEIAALVLRQGTRFVAIASYGAAVAVAFVLLSPILPNRGSDAAAVVPSGPQPILYTMRTGDTSSGIAASQGISLAQLYALNPALTPFTHAAGEPVVVGLR
jgi:LysM repeat protein